MPRLKSADQYPSLKRILCSNYVTHNARLEPTRPTSAHSQDTLVRSLLQCSEQDFYLFIFFIFFYAIPNS